MVKVMNNDDKKDVPFYVEDFTASFFEQEKQLSEECDKEEWVDLEFIEIFNGKTISIWKEGELYHFTTANVTLNFLEDEWKEFKKDLNKFNDL